MSELAELPGHERAAYLQEAAARLGLLPLVIEKDFWVCWRTLRLVPPTSRRRELESDYGKMAPMFFHSPRPFAEVLRVLEEAEREINGG